MMTSTDGGTTARDVASHQTPELWAKTRSGAAKTIMVNGRSCRVYSEEVSHHQLVRIAFPEGVPPRLRHDASMTVTYLRGPAPDAEGVLGPLDRIPVVEGEVFSVTRTDRS